MDAQEFRRAIEAKRDGARLGDAIWHELIRAYLADTVDDAPMAALLMACLWRGLDRAEAAALTAAFVDSGERLERADARTVDKHSSGGVGDTASLIVVPLVAACGVPVAKLSGHALGHTGGTLDKLEAVPGVRVDFSPQAFAAIVDRAGCAIAAQSERLVPADKRIYALRDRTGTVPSPGLIAASIVSKKIAGGAHGIVYDVKTGNGAFMREPGAARELARTLVELTAAFGRRATALVTDMNEPLGPAVGSGLETIEAREFLRGGRRDPRLRIVVEALAQAMLAVAEPADALAAAGSGDRPAFGTRVTDALESGAAYTCFERMLDEQGARPGALVSLEPHPQQKLLVADATGSLERVDCVALGELARDLVARSGPFAGVFVHARTGAAARADMPLVTLFGDARPDDLERARAAFAFGRLVSPAAPRPLIYEEIGARAATGTRS